MEPWSAPGGAEYQRLRRAPVRGGKLLLQLAIAAIAGGTAGTALAVVGWAWTLLGSRGSSCFQGGDSPFPSGGPCWNGVGPVLRSALLAALVAGVLAVVLLFLKGWARRLVVVIAFLSGVFAGQPLWAGEQVHGLPVAWTAPGDPTERLITEGAWTAGGSLILIRTDQLQSYDAATGRVQWTLPLPGGSALCAVSKTSAGAVGLVGYGRTDDVGDLPSGACDHVMAIDLRAGRQLWSMRVPADGSSSGRQPPGTLAVAGQTAVLLTSPFRVMAVDARSGARRWTRPAALDCAYRQVAASALALVAVADCSSGSSVTAIDPVTGRQAWQALLPGGSGPGQVTILSASPVVIGSWDGGASGSLLVRVLGPGGVVTATFPVDIAGRQAYGVGFPSPLTVSGGLLVGAADPVGNGMLDPGTAVAAYRLADGRLLWRDAVPAGVASIAFADGEAAIIDESGPYYSLRKVNLGTGRMRPLGHIPPADLAVRNSGLYVVASRYVVVNCCVEPSVAAFTVPDV